MTFPVKISVVKKWLLWMSFVLQAEKKSRMHVFKIKKTTVSTV